MNYQTHIFMTGNSQAVRLPKALLEFLGFGSGDEVTLSADQEANAIIIQKAKPVPYKSIKDLFAGYSGDYRPAEWDTGQGVGKELL